jgi:hypothetical protein
MAQVKVNSHELKKMKVLFRRGLNATSGAFVAGSKVRFIHSK